MASRAQPLKMGLHQIQQLKDGVDDNDAVNKSQLDAAVATIDLSAYAPLASPTLTGDPKAPTPSPGDNDTSIATTAFVATSFAPLASPALTGTPTAPTASPGDNDTSIATTAFVTAAITAANRWTLIKKTADQTISASTTFVDDNTLKFAVTSGKQYVWRGMLLVDSTAGGYKAAINGPTFSTSELRANAGGTAATAYDTNFTANASAGVFALNIWGYFNCATTGTLALRIAQNSASGSTTFEKGCWIEWMEFA